MITEQKFRSQPTIITKKEKKLPSNSMLTNSVCVCVGCATLLFSLQNEKNYIESEWRSEYWIHLERNYLITQWHRKRVSMKKNATKKAKKRERENENESEKLWNEREHIWKVSNSHCHIATHIFQRLAVVTVLENCFC